ncbi:hypothetical protein H9649_10050 [Sporosarcina sp. Sa2YVA2]|uniref:HEAT repeat domain-containing protein n=1 Tax=Sporosarcina quadrami TaxID=2762234 RepID=A0ABR8UA85_9BACL|nr:hypothetical protein [Sporosarcina quadrami]MBD7984927.1 hypothetical protein [Sporosarcina quadrami]
MMQLPIEWLLVIVVGLLIALLVMTVYMMIGRARENRRQVVTTAYLERNQEDWYDYLCVDGIPREELIPKNTAELKALEELFRSLVHNIKSEEIDKRISAFANRCLGNFYRDALRKGNWGERVNALSRIRDFGIDSLAKECREMLARKTVSKEEFFLLLLIDMKFNPETFSERHIGNLDKLSSKDTKELLFSMSDLLFDQIVETIDHLPARTQYAVVDVIGMKLNASRSDKLEQLFSSSDNELRIRILRAFNLLERLPADEVLIAAIESDRWQERLQAARLFHLLPAHSAVEYSKILADDEHYLIREEIRRYLAQPAFEVQVDNEAVSSLRE